MAVPFQSGTEILVNTNTLGNQNASSVAALAHGKFVVTWTDDDANPLNRDVKAQIFNADGSKFGAELTIATGAGDQRNSVVAALPDGRFVIAYEDFNAASGVADGAGSAIGARIFNEDGTPAGSAFRVNTTTALNQTQPAIAVGADGGFAISFTHQASAANLDVRARFFNASGSPIGNDTFIDTSGANNENNSAAARLSNGNFTFAVADEGAAGQTDGSGRLITGATRTATGVLVTAAHTLNSPGLGVQDQPAIAGLSNGTFVAIWTDHQTGMNDLRMRLFDNGGVAIVGTNKVLDGTINAAETEATVVSTPDGFIVAWTDGGNDADTDGAPGAHIRAQMFDNAGAVASDQFVINTVTIAGNQSAPSITVLDDGRILISWTDPGTDATQTDHSGMSVHAAIFDPRTEAVTFPGTDAGDDFVGTKFADTLAGGKGADRLSGGAGKDDINGGAGKDVIAGNKGADLIDLGKDNKHDLVVYSAEDDTGKSSKKADHIHNFDQKDAGEHKFDQIDLSALDADSKKGDQAFRFEPDGYKSAHGKQPDGQVTLVDSGKDVLVKIDLDGDNHTDMLIKVFDVHTLHESDFIL